MKDQPDDDRTTAGWCWYCNAKDIDYCKGGDEQGRCRFNDNPVTKAPSENRITPDDPAASPPVTHAGIEEAAGSVPAAGASPAPETTEIATIIADDLTNSLKDRGEIAAAREIERLRSAIHDHKAERSRLLGALRDLQWTVSNKISEALNG